MNSFYANINWCSKLILLIFTLSWMDMIGQYAGGAGDGGTTANHNEFLFPANLIFGGGTDDGYSMVDDTTSVCIYIFSSGGAGDGGSNVFLNGYVTGNPIFCAGGEGDGHALMYQEDLDINSQFVFCAGGAGDGANGVGFSDWLVTAVFCAGGEGDGQYLAEIPSYVLGAGLWTGYVSTHWQSYANWTNSSLPNDNTSVTIPAGCFHYPDLVKNFSVQNPLWGEINCYRVDIMDGDNAWRTSTAVPLNWDAAWVFVKYKVGADPWKHAKISPTGYVAPSLCSIDVPSDSTGAFIYISIDGNGNIAFEEVELQWDYGANGVGDDDQVEIKVFAIEMVYISAGPYYLGDGLNESGRGQFHQGDSEDPYYVVSEDSILGGIGAGKITANYGFTGGLIPTAYPKGFNAYYCMKYEISQEQYLEFLNALTRTQQNYHTNTDISGTSVTNHFVMANATTPNGNNGIRCYNTIPATGPVTFYMDLDNDGVMNEANDGHTHPANYLRWMDIAAYLDWAALRPLSEMEYEKACRGPKDPVSGEFVWGTTQIHSSSYTISNFGSPNESIDNPGTFTGNVCYASTRGARYNFRCGIFAASAVNSSRQETGSGYYGCMELAGNLYEQVVRAGFAAGRSYTGLHGNGELNEEGHADTDYWPGMGGNSNVSIANTVYNPVSGTGVTAAAGACPAGGFSQTNNSNDLRSSDRYNRGAAGATSFFPYYGGRGCRTAD